MGFLFLATETFLAILSAYSFSIVIAGGRSVVDRAILTLIVSLATVLVVVYSCGLLGLFSALPVGITAALLHLAILAWSASRGLCLVPQSDDELLVAGREIDLGPDAHFVH